MFDPFTSLPLRILWVWFLTPCSMYTFLRTTSGLLYSGFFSMVKAWWRRGCGETSTFSTGCCSVMVYWLQVTLTYGYKVWVSTVTFWTEYVSIEGFAIVFTKSSVTETLCWTGSIIVYYSCTSTIEVFDSCFLNSFFSGVTCFYFGVSSFSVGGSLGFSSALCSFGSFGSFFFVVEGCLIMTFGLARACCSWSCNSFSLLLKSLRAS